jgi:hypothetical protein
VSMVTAGIRIGRPGHSHAWRDKEGQAHATVSLAEYTLGATLYFDSAQDARDVAAACLQAAEAIGRLTAEVA